MRRFGQILTVLIIAFSASGCVTRDASLSGTLQARIVDATTRSPVVGAKVALRSQEVPAASAQAVSDSAGFVTIPPLKGKMTALFYGDFFAKPATLTVEASGYEPLVVEIPNVWSDADKREHYYRNPNDPRVPVEILLTKQPG